MEIKRMRLADIKLAHYNPRKDLKPGDPEYEKLKRSIEEFDCVEPLVWNRRSKRLIGGHQRLKILKEKGIKEFEVSVVDLDERKEKALNVALNKIQGEWDFTKLADLITELDDGEFDLELTGFDLKEIEEIMSWTPDPGGDKEIAHKKLTEQFIIPPFSILDTRQGYWQERKKAWLSLGIQGELGRGNNLLGMRQSGLMGEKWTSRKAADRRSNLTGAPRTPKWAVGTGMTNMAPGTSIFDPVLCEVIYRWFCPKDGSILDPFAGGSVRGIVAGYLGYDYTGIELRAEQVKANEVQRNAILGDVEVKSMSIIKDGLTPIEGVEGFFVKREDLFSIADVRGGKARTCWYLAQGGAKGLVTAGSRQSPQANIVAHIAQHLGIPCHIHTPGGKLSRELEDAKRCGAEIIQHKAGYNNVIIARARDDAKRLGWTNIPFGMECEEAVEQTRQQVTDIPKTIKRIVISVGSGMSLAGILWGLEDLGLSIPVLGVKVGADPVKRLDKYAPTNWRKIVKLMDCGVDYHTEVKGEIVANNGEVIQLDPVYEAKCLPYLQPSDLFWIVGLRRTSEIVKTNVNWITGDSQNIDKLGKDQYDLIFSCPPYFDLEHYTEDAKDLSNMNWSQFTKTYQKIIGKTLAFLKDNRFACFVVSEIRDNKGWYRNFVALTKRCFEESGVRFYNDIILINPEGTLPIRIGRQFNSYRKVGKMHQNVLVFYKGDIKKIKETYPEVEVADLENEEQT